MGSSQTVEDLVAALRAIIDGAVDADGVERDLTEEEQERYAQTEGRLAVARRSAEIRSRQAAYDTPAGGPRPATRPARQATAEPEEDDQYRAFVHYLRTGTPNQDLEYRAQSEGTGSEGGFLVPELFRNKLQERMKSFGGIGEVVEQITTGNGNPISWPTVDDTGNVGEIVSEGGAWTSGADVAFGSKNLGAYTYGTSGPSGTPVRISLELIQDAAVDIVALVTRLLGLRLARIQATHLVTGDGVAKPQGILDGLTGIEIAADTDGITYADLVTFVHSIDPAYRPGARWAFNDQTLSVLRKIRDADGRPLLQPQSTGTMAGAPGGETLLGYPVTIDQAFPNFVANSNTVNWGVFGDLRQGYVRRQVRDVTLVVNPWSRANNRQVEYSAWARMDAVQQDTFAYVALTGEA